MQLGTKLIPLASSLVVAIEGVRHPGLSLEDQPELGMARATCLDLASGASVDLTDSVFPVREASESEGKYWQKMAAGQLEFSTSSDYPASTQEYYADNHKKFLTRAQIARSGSRWLVSHVLPCGSDRVLVTISCSTQSPRKIWGILRVVNVHTGAIEFEKCTEPQLMGVEAGALTKVLAVHSSGNSALFTETAESGFMGLGSPKVATVQRRLSAGLKKLRTVKAVSPNPSAQRAAWKNFWITTEEDSDDSATLFIIDASSAKVVQSIPLPRYPRSLSTAANEPVVAVGCIGGAVTILSIGGSELREELRPILGARRDDWPVVTLSGDGRFLCTQIGNRATIMNLADKTVCELPPLKNMERMSPIPSLENISASVSPAVGLVGQHLVTLDAQGLRAVALEKLRFSRREKPSIENLTASTFKKPVAEIASALKGTKLKRHASELSKFYAPAVLLPTKATKDAGWNAPEQGGPELGTSRLGGWPDMPKGTQWPTWDSRPMSFLAQINLEEAHAESPHLRVPKEGLLLFFLGCSDETYDNEDDNRERYFTDMMLGSEPEHRDGWKVIYVPKSSDLVRTPWKSAPYPELHNPAVCLPEAGGRTFPDESTAIFSELGFTDAEQECYNAILKLTGPADEDEKAWTNQLMGHPMLIQFTPPELFCAAASSGLNPWSSLDDKEVQKASSEWCLLLQLTSDPNADFCWGDGGHLYFYGKRDKVEKGDFSETWVFYEN